MSTAIPAVESIMISVVVPVFNEQDSLAILYDELARVALRANLRFEVLFVDAGSSDGSRALICPLAAQHADLHRFIPVLAAARGFKVAEIPINHRTRKFGHSKYGVRRFVKAFLDLLTVKFLTGFGQRPQHLLGSIGLLSFALGMAGMVWLAVTWIWRFAMKEFFNEEWFLPLHQRPLLIYSVAATLLGAQMMSIGFLAELITAYQGRDLESYSIKEKTTGLRHDVAVTTTSPRS